MREYLDMIDFKEKEKQEEKFYEMRHQQEEIERLKEIQKIETVKESDIKQAKIDKLKSNLDEVNAERKFNDETEKEFFNQESH
jgi:hypothetical protein